MRVGYIYEIKSMDISITETYIGSTWDMKDRLIKHASNCYNENSKDYNYPIYKYIRENGGFHTFTMRVIDSGECEDETELHCAEQFYIDIAGGIENLLNEKDALVDKEKRKEKQDIDNINRRNKNIETKRYPCNLCRIYFGSNIDLKRHIAGPKHKKKLSQIVTV
tara:strand:+ start:76 stop:570 length:495 start_codon:yes stop_codon:yes gene_type:complete